MVSRRLQACFQQVSKHSVHLFWSFDCFAALRAHSRAGAPLVLRLFASRSRSLGWRPGWSFGCSAALRASCLPRSTAPLRARALAAWAGAPDWSLDCSAALRASCLPSARLLRCAPPRCLARSAALRASCLPARLLRCAARRAWAGAPGWSFGCSAALRASCLPARLLRCAPRLVSPGLAPLRCSAAWRLVSSAAPLRSCASCLPAPLRSALAPGLAPRLPLRVLHFASRAPG